MQENQPQTLITMHVELVEWLERRTRKQVFVVRRLLVPLQASNCIVWFTKVSVTLNATIVNSNFFISVIVT